MATCLNSLYVNNLSGCKSYKVLSVGKLSTCCVSKYYVTLCTVPVLLAAGLVTTSLNCGYVCKSNLCCDNNVLEVGLLSKSLVSPSKTAVGTVPILYVTVLVANSLCRCYVLYVVSSLSVNKLAAGCAVSVTLVGELVNVRNLNGNCNGSALESNCYGAAGLSYGVVLVSRRICSAPIVVTYYLELVGACCNVGVNLSVNTVSIGHIVCGIGGIPLLAKVCAAACYGKGSLLAASGAVVSAVKAVTECGNYRVATIETNLSGCTGCCITKIGVHTGRTECAPGSATAVPGALLNGIVISSTSRNSKICSLVPLVVPVVCRCVRIHSAEDNVRIGLIGRNLNLINAVSVRVSHANPGLAISEEICCKTSVIYLPVCIGSEIKSLGLGCRRRNDGQAHKNCHKSNKSNQNSTCLHCFSPFQRFMYVFHAMPIISLRYFIVNRKNKKKYLCQRYTLCPNISCIQLVKVYIIFLHYLTNVSNK